ncbi:helix-turn-helix domain-containing protein [Streptomyces sp. NRRL F-5126]|uniref:helix-turn-helix domain-containing protein n=1 Tax=Streptomyces sp. NRRL F-5126 TaxID=1463857 RepID=UPI0004C79889|nr:XRE family transcriptional regulator [Streptomyces sp. NRRL F-5126]
MADDDLAHVLTSVGPRLRALRQSRGTTLAALSETTGISLSTLSRLESGGRRPSLELLLPLSKAYGVPLDELVGTQERDDPRVRSRPFVRHGTTFFPLTRHLGGLLAYKAIVPPGLPGARDERLEQRSHEGYEWLYILNGQLRLALGDHDLTLAAGEVAEFDTRTPHGFVNAGDRPAEYLALFGPQGERMHVRARPAER